MLASEWKPEPPGDSPLAPPGVSAGSPLAPPGSRRARSGLLHVVEEPFGEAAQLVGRLPALLLQPPVVGAQLQHLAGTQVTSHREHRAAIRRRASIFNETYSRAPANSVTKGRGVSTFDSSRRRADGGTSRARKWRTLCGIEGSRGFVTDAGHSVTDLKVSGSESVISKWLTYLARIFTCVDHNISCHIRHRVDEIVALFFLVNTGRFGRLPQMRNPMYL